MQQRLNIKPWDNSNLPSGTKALPNFGAEFDYPVNGDPVNGFTIQATGRRQDAAKTVRGRLRLAGLWEYAIFGTTSVNLAKDNTVDAYNLGVNDWPLQIATNSLLASSITMGPGVTVDGDVLAGAGAIRRW